MTTSNSWKRRLVGHLLLGLLCCACAACQPSDEDRSAADQVRAIVLQGNQSEPPFLDVRIEIPQSLLRRLAPSGSSLTAFTAVLTGLFTLLGSAIVLLFNHLRARSDRKMDWAKTCWSLYGEQYLEFIETVRSTPDLQLLDRRWQAARLRALFPIAVSQEVSELLSLRGGQAPQTKVDATRLSVLQTLEGFSKEPWRFF